MPNQSKLNMTLLDIMELYKNAKRPFPLHRFYIKLDTQFQKEFYKAYYATHGFKSTRSLKQPKLAERFLKYLYRDVRLAGIGELVKKVKIKDVHYFNTKIFAGKCAFSLVYVIAVQRSLPKELRGGKFSLKELSKSENMPLYFGGNTAKGNWYKMLNTLFKSDTMINLVDFCSTFQLAVQNRLRGVENLINKELAHGEDSLIFLEGDTKKSYGDVGLKGKVYE